MQFATKKNIHPVPDSVSGKSDCPFDYKTQSRDAEILLLQGPTGFFFRRLRNHLTHHGYTVRQVCFNAGDRLFADRAERIDFRGNQTEWQHWLDNLLASGSVDSIILYGADRPAHRVARAVARTYGVRIFALEEGYIRPGYVTVEEQGNNAASPRAGQMPPPDYQPSEKTSPPEDFRSLKIMGLYAALYYGLCGFFPRQNALRHRPLALLPELFCWTRNLCRRILGQWRNAATIRTLLQDGQGRYILVPLQVETDCNMQEAALGWSSTRLIATSLHSFARHAPLEKRLVFKIHPMARGYNNHAARIRAMAAALNIADRVDVIDTGSMGLLARHAAGMITINSTSGLSAIYHGIPLLVIGRALYAHPALAICAQGQPDFDRFWHSPPLPQAARDLRRRWIDWIRETALIPGDFYDPRGMERACTAILQKLQDEQHTPAVNQEMRTAC